MNEKDTNPYYKERKSKPLHRSGLSFGLPKEVKDDFEEYIKRNYPNISFNKAMNHIILDLLNNQCLERKYFNIDVIGVFPIYQSYDKLKEFIDCKYFASRDIYSVNRNELDTNTNSFIELKEYKYLSESVRMSVKNLYKVYIHNSFNHMILNHTVYDLEDFHHSFESALNINDGHYDIVHFKINNYLDDFIDGIYRSPNNKRNHMGIGYYISDEDYRYFMYEWYFDKEMEFHIDHISLISEDDFRALIHKSSNDDLKEQFKDFNPSNEKTLEERILELEFINENLIQRLLKRNEHITHLNNENKILKTQNQTLKSIVEENKPKVEASDKIFDLLEKFEFIDSDEEEFDTQK